MSRRMRPRQHNRRLSSPRYAEKRGRTITINKGITHEQFTHTDFDKDKTKNIDDTYPFDPTRKRPVDRDSRLSRELNVIEDYRFKHLEAMRSVRKKVEKNLKENKKVHVVSRLKSTPSIINKLNRKYLPKVRDTAGVMIEADNREALERAEQRVRKMKRLNITKVEDFYDPKNSRPYYKAVHFDVKHDEKPVETQLKTIRQRRLHDKMHAGHKTGRDTGPFTIKQAKKQAQERDFRDKTPPHKHRKLKRLPDLQDDSGSQDFYTRLIRRK